MSELTFIGITTGITILMLFGWYLETRKRENR